MSKRLSYLCEHFLIITTLCTFFNSLGRDCDNPKYVSLESGRHVMILTTTTGSESPHAAGGRLGRDNRLQEILATGVYRGYVQCVKYVLTRCLHGCSSAVFDQGFEH
jgi:hypothetical protein